MSDWHAGYWCGLRVVENAAMAFNIFRNISVVQKNIAPHISYRNFGIFALNKSKEIYCAGALLISSLHRKTMSKICGRMSFVASTKRAVDMLNTLRSNNS